MIPKPQGWQGLNHLSKPQRRRVKRRFVALRFTSLHSLSSFSSPGWHVALFLASFNDTKLLHSRARSGVLRSSKSGVTNQPALNVTLLANITLQVHCLPDISVGNQTKQTCITTRGGRNGHVRPKKPQIGRWSRNRCSLFFVICESVLA